MGKIDDAIQTIEGIENGTERAMQLAGLISTLFKIKGVVLVVTGQLACDGYSNSTSEHPSLDLGAFAGKLTLRTVLEVMRGQLPAVGSMNRWIVAGIPVFLEENPTLAQRELCRDFTTGLGVVKLAPVEEITADCILAAIHPQPDAEAHARAHHLLMNGLTEAFDMNWTVLHTLCHRPEYRVGEELAQMRLAAKRDVDAAGMARDHVGETRALPDVAAVAAAVAEAQPVAEPALPEEIAAFAEPAVAVPVVEELAANPEAGSLVSERKIINLAEIDPKLIVGELPPA